MLIWKNVLNEIDLQEVEMPRGSEILCVREQHERVCLWFRCNPDEPPVKRTIVMCGTGHQALAQDRYIGTGFLSGGQLVLHVFERTK